MNGRRAQLILDDACGDLTEVSVNARKAAYSSFSGPGTMGTAPEFFTVDLHN